LKKKGYSLWREERRIGVDISVKWGGSFLDTKKTAGRKISLPLPKKGERVLGKRERILKPGGDIDLNIGSSK